MTDTTWASSPYTIHVAVDAHTADWLEAEARQAGASVIHLSLAGVDNLDDLDERLAQTFTYPFRARGLDAAVSLIADLEWFGNAVGYLIIVDTANAPTAIATDVASIFPNILDRWRTQQQPFVVALRGNTDWTPVMAALKQSNQRLAEAGREPWDIGNTHAVSVVDHR